MKKTFLLLLLSHTFVDFFMGIWPVYKTMASIDIAMAGLIMGIAVFTGDILQVGFGILSDRGHQKKLLVLGLLTSAAALFLTFTSGLWSVLALMLLAMIGSSSFHPSALGLVNQFRNSKNNPVLLFSAFGTLGLALSQIVFIRFTNLFGGHAHPLIVPLIIILFFWLFHRLPTQQIEKKKFSLREFFTPFLAHKRSLILLYITQVLCYGVLLAVMFMLPDILQYKNSSPWLTWGGGHMCLIFGSMIGMLLFSSLSERIGYRKTLLGAILSSFILLNIFLFSPLPPGLLSTPFLAILGAALYLTTPVVISWGNKLVPESPSTVSGLLMGLAWALSSLVPGLSGFIANSFSTSPYTMTISLLSLLLIPSFFCITLMPSLERKVYN
ncbi:MAG: MFS transporter [Simkaniaceae bacterium]|nr:MFS transporter [Candidatus Sacchlamyda saccharinae]